MSTSNTIRDLVENEIQEQLGRAFEEIPVELWRINVHGDFEFSLPSGKTAILEIDKLTDAILDHVSACIRA